jgi:predicted O-methyltransferase YrrM
MSVTQFLHSRGFYCFEGYSQEVEGQVADLIALTNKPNIKVMEIGFNAGHSAEIFLKHNKDLTVTSFDLGRNSYVSTAKEYIDKTYPGRHTLILGDSTKTVPIFNPDGPFDFIFIDGGHEYDIASADFRNCFRLAHRDTIVALDDTMFTEGWVADHNIGPTRTWLENLKENKIVELARKDYIPSRGMTWGKYVF